MEKADYSSRKKAAIHAGERTAQFIMKEAHLKVGLPIPTKREGRSSTNRIGKEKEEAWHFY